MCMAQRQESTGSCGNAVPGKALLMGEGNQGVASAVLGYNTHPPELLVPRPGSLPPSVLCSLRVGSQRRQLFPAAHFPLICHRVLSCSCLASALFGSFRGRDCLRSRFLGFRPFYRMLKKHETYTRFLPRVETSQFNREL